MKTKEEIYLEALQAIAGSREPRRQLVRIAKSAIEEAKRRDEKDILLPKR